jgi:starch phosphorylase
MKPVRTFNVSPALPPALEHLRDLAFNLRWAWNHDTIELFRRLDADLWETTNHNPVLMLGTIDQEKLAAAAADEGFRIHLERVHREFAEYLASETTWFRRVHGATDGPEVAYFSAEFGLTDCLSIFAGGLGLLAGDHLKSASDLGLPIVGVGLLYQEGYFRQNLSESGWQQEAQEDNDFYNLPLALEVRPDGRPLTVTVPHPGRSVAVHIWRAEVGRLRLYLLDTNLASNLPDDRRITQQLYGGDGEMRVRQEIVLGIGGYRALEALGLKPRVYHMNEGHSAFLALERIRHLMETARLTFAEAREAAAAGLLFTTHTPVAAGHDYFGSDLIRRHFSDYASALGLSLDQFMALGRQDPANGQEPFCMTVLALRLSMHGNGVSRLHGQVSRKMWRALWPGVAEAEIPIGHVTNGVHFHSWLSLEMAELYDRYLGPRWGEEPADRAIWQRVETISSGELWRTHERRRERLVAFARRRLRRQLQRQGIPWREIETAGEALDPEVLTIGFGRRFATYKRATLLLRDPDRLARIVGDAQRPVQIIFSGKAHPQDDAGKKLIQQIITLSRQEPFRRRLVFLEDYDLAAARALVQGADVWLNTPRRPMEASGTSGMKAAANGVLNLSTLDGWWDEAWRDAERAPVPIGWAIGRGEAYDNPDQQDDLEAEALYGLLEQEVVPAFYTRGPDGLPRLWIDRMKASIGALCHYYNTHRMVREYTERFYLPAAAHERGLAEDEWARARALAAWRARIEGSWDQVRVEAVDSTPAGGIQVGGELCVRARVRLGDLTPEDVAVELCLGRLAADGNFLETETTPMRTVSPAESDGWLFEGAGASCLKSGLHGLTVRVLPRHVDLPNRFPPGKITWAS